MSVCSVLNKLSKYIYFYISKSITACTFVACFQNRRKPSVLRVSKNQMIKISIHAV